MNIYKHTSIGFAFFLQQNGVLSTYNCTTYIICIPLSHLRTFILIAITSTMGENKTYYAYLLNIMVSTGNEYLPITELFVL